MHIIRNHNKRGLFWTETHPTSKFGGKPFSGFCEILLTNQSNNNQTNDEQKHNCTYLVLHSIKIWCGFIKGRIYKRVYWWWSAWSVNQSIRESTMYKLDLFNSIRTPTYHWTYKHLAQCSLTVTFLQHGGHELRLKVFFFKSHIFQ